MKRSGFEVLESYRDGEFALVDTNDEYGRYAVAREYYEETEVWTSADRFNSLEEARKEYAKKTILADGIAKVVFATLDLDESKDAGVMRSIREKIDGSDFGELLHPDFVRYCEKQKSFEEIRNMEFPTIHTMEDLINVIEIMEWNVTDDGTTMELQQESPAGENFFFTAYKGESLQDCVNDIVDYCRNFDEEEHAELWMKFSGDRGVPDSTTLVEDAKDIQVMLEKLRLALSCCKVEEREKEYEGR